MRSIPWILILASIAIPTAFAESGTGLLGDSGTIITGDEADVSPPMIEERLRHAGYTQIMFLDHNEFSVSAFDRQGSEVILTISPQTGDVVGSRHVHAMDD